MSRTCLKGVLISLWLVLALTVDLLIILASSDEIERWAKAGSPSHNILGVVPAAQEVRKIRNALRQPRYQLTSTPHSCSNSPAFCGLFPDSMGGRKQLCPTPQAIGWDHAFGTHAFEVSMWEKKVEAETHPRVSAQLPHRRAQQDVEHHHQSLSESNTSWTFMMSLSWEMCSMYNISEAAPRVRQTHPLCFV